MPVTLGGQSCQDPRQLWETCRQFLPPLSTEPWFGLVNQFVCPLGPDPGIGHLIMSRRNLSALDPNAKQNDPNAKYDINAKYDLVFTYGTGKRTFKNLLVTSDVCVSPGLRGDLAGTRYLTVADRRKELALVPINKAYNLWAADGSDYLPATLRGLYPWTWQQMVDDIVGVLGISLMTLPYVPDSLPDNWDFYGDTAWHALNAILAKLDMAIRWNPEADTFSIVELGAADAMADAALVIADSFRDWDWEPVGLTRARVPAKVWVQFRRFPEPSDGSSHFFMVERSAPGTITTATATGSKIVLPDDLPALCDGSNNVTNSSDCGTRATQRRDKYYQALAAWAVTPLSRRYVGVLGGSAVLPGPQISSYAVHDLGGGYRTELARLRVPKVDVEFFQPVVATGGGGGAGDEYVVVKDQGTQSTLGGNHHIYDADFPDPEWTANDFQETSFTQIWLVHRRGRPLYPELVVAAHPTGQNYDPHPGGVGGTSDSRELWSTIAVEEDHLVIASTTPTTSDEGVVCFAANVEFWDRATKAKQTRTGTVYVMDWEGHSTPFTAGVKFKARFIDRVKVSGIPAALFEVPVHAVTTDFIRCFMNKFEGRKGELRAIGNLFDFLNQSCVVDTDLNGACIDGG